MACIFHNRMSMRRAAIFLCFLLMFWRGRLFATAFVTQREAMPSRSQSTRTNRLSSIHKEALETTDETWEQMPLLKDILESSSAPRIPLVDSTKESDTSQTPAQKVAMLSMCVMASSVLVLLFEALTMQFEAIQAWRYTWPIVGILYIAASLLLANNSKENGIEIIWNNILPNRQAATLASVSSILGGAGLLIGGCYDIFAPVWVSSPDLLGTRTGLESDSAALLLLLTIGLGSRLHLTPIRALFLAVLSAQLYMMGTYTFTAFGELLGLISK